MKGRNEQDDEFFMKEAIKLAETHMKEKDGGPFGAVIILDGKIIARGWNRVTSDNDPTAHAEIDCIRKACSHLKSFDLSGCDLFVNCEPCPMCLAAAYWARIRSIIYGADQNDATKIGFADGFIYSEVRKDVKERTIPMRQLLRSEALTTFTEWEEMEDKILY